MYDELIKSLRQLCEITAMCDDHVCFECPHEEECSSYKNGRLSAIYRQAADAIEELLDFAHYVASEVVVPDEEWENNIHYAFPEIVSRKLNKLGIVEKDGAFWHYEPPKEET